LLFESLLPLSGESVGVEDGDVVVVVLVVDVEVDVIDVDVEEASVTVATMRTGSREKTWVELLQSQPVKP
jgi:hypothetical protein